MSKHYQSGYDELTAEMLASLKRENRYWAKAHGHPLTLCEHEYRNEYGYCGECGVFNRAHYQKHSRS